MKERAFLVSVPAEKCFLRSIRGFYQPLLDEAFGEAEARMLILALDEACSNIIKHAGENPDPGRRIDAQAAVAEGGIRFRIRDFCGAADVPNIRPRDLADVRPGGLGTHFINQIMDRIVFEPEPDLAGRVALVMEKRVKCAEKDGRNEA